MACISKSSFRDWRLVAVPRDGAEGQGGAHHGRRLRYLLRDCQPVWSPWGPGGDYGATETGPGSCSGVVPKPWHSGIEGDVRKEADASRVVETVVNEFGRLDILINGAAGNFLVAPEDLSPNGFKTGRLREGANRRWSHH